jgi:hypothetical protein
MQEKVSRKLFGQLAEMILEGGAKKVTKYISPKLTVKATFQGKRDKRDRQVTLLFTVGRPNYCEREFIKRCQRINEPFPVKKVQIQWPKNA